MAITRVEQAKTAQRGLAFGLEQKMGVLNDLDSEAKLDPAQRVARERSALAALPDQDSALRRVERILEGNELTDISYLERGVVSGQSVARILLRTRGRVSGYGTGFLVAPGVLMTNEHVLSHLDEVGEASAQFRYEFGLNGEELAPAEFSFRTDIAPIFHGENDFALVAVASVSTTGEPLDSFGWLHLDPTPGKGILGEFLTVIQHPGGERKQVCVRENQLIYYDPDGHYVWYQTDTVGGSSGSPVFNNSWDVVGLHHSGVARTEVDENGDLHYLNRDGDRWDPEEGDDSIDWYANEGIRISRIMAYLASEHPEHELTRAVLSAGPAPNPRSRAGGPAVASGVGFSLPLQIPITVSIGTTGGPSLVIGSAASAVAPAPPRPPARADTGRSSSLPLAPEKVVVINQKNYDERNGYDANFLGSGELRVQLPVLESEDLGEPVEVSGSKRLKYYNYTIMMNQDRRLAYYCAANVVPKKGKGTRPNDKWFRDTRITGDDDRQTGEEFYGTQRDFEVRELNPFDRGHLSSRQNLQWGDTLPLAVRNGDESYHFTNCAPQHLAFNQNRTVNGLWRGLELHAIEHTKKVPLCIINGPVFDAPLSRETATGLLALVPDGPRSPDPTFNGVAIPKQFFKIIAWKTKDDRLSAMGFVVTQENVLRSVQRIDWPALQPTPEEAALTEGEIFLYQLPIATIGALTNMRFGSRLSRHDTRPELDEATGIAGLIGNLGDVRFFD